ncbi:MAG: ion transporter [Paracoccus sp. (in: a-proteobacteria)]
MGISKPRDQIRAVLQGHGRLGKAVNLTLFAATIAAAILVMLETVPSIIRRHGQQLFAVEITLSALFSVEYLLRIYASPNRLRYIFSFWGAVDFLSSLPVMLAFSGNTTIVRSLRLFRLARLLKLLRIGDAYDRIIGAFAAVSKELMVFLCFAAVLLYFASIGIYFFEHGVQPEAFGSAPESLWWALVTLTTVGYGDVYPITTGGRIFTGLLLLIGLSIVAIPTGLLSSALIEARRQQSQQQPD